MHNKEIPVLLILDMVRDHFDKKRNLPITKHARNIIPYINRISNCFRGHGWPVIFPTDAFGKDDYFFTGGRNIHSLAGTLGEELVDDLERTPEDYWVPKPRMSAFFKTGLEQWLKDRDISLCAIGGIATNFCVLSSAFDALNRDFKVVLLEDCCAAAYEPVHQQTLALYRRNFLHPLFKIMNSEKLILELEYQR